MIELKVGNSVRVKNDIFPSYGCVGVITNIDGFMVSVRMKRRHRKLDESEFVVRQYYPGDLRLVS